MTKQAQEFLTRTPLCQLMPIPTGALESCVLRTHELLCSGDPATAEILARGLVAADHTHWYHRALLAIALQMLGRRAEALEVVDEGLALVPADAELRALRACLAPRTVGH